MSHKLLARQTLTRLRRTDNVERANGIAASYLTLAAKAPGHRVTVGVGTALWEVRVTVYRRRYYGAGSNLYNAVQTLLNDYVAGE